MVMKHLLVTYRDRRGHEHDIELFADRKNIDKITSMINNRKHSHAPVKVHNIIERGESISNRKNNTLVYLISIMIVIAFWTWVYFGFIR
jgi:hypothetical protein